MRCGVGPTFAKDQLYFLFASSVRPLAAEVVSMQACRPLLDPSYRAYTMITGGLGKPRVPCGPKQARETAKKKQKDGHQP